MTIHVMNAVIEYAKIFDQKGKYADLDRGDAQSQHKWLRELAKVPETKFNMYFTSEEDLQALLQSDDFENETTNPKTGEKGTRIKDGNPEYGIGKYISLVLKSTNMKEYKDRKTGEIKEFDAGGILKVTAYNAEEDTFEPYDYDALGAPANGSEARVRFDDRYMRPMNLGFTTILEYVEGEDGCDF